MRGLAKRFFPGETLNPVVPGEPTGPREARPDDKAPRGPGPILRELSIGRGVWVPAFAGTTVKRKSLGRFVDQGAHAGRWRGLLKRGLFVGALVNAPLYPPARRDGPLRRDGVNADT